MKKKAFFSILMSFLAAFFAACGSDSGSASGAGENSGTQADLSAATFDELPNCSINREGNVAYVEAEDANYVCVGRHWIFQEPPMDSVATEDDLPACMAKREGDSLFVKSDEVAYVCIEGRWEATASTKMKSYETEDNLPNCSEKREGESALVEKDSTVRVCVGGAWVNLGTAVANEDALQNCTAKREGSKVYAVESARNLVCTSGKWVDASSIAATSSSSRDDVSSSSSSSVIASSSSRCHSESSTECGDEEPGSSSHTSFPEGVMEWGYYDCSEYNCVDTLYLSDVKRVAGAYGEFLDTRDNKVYKAVTIGEQTWMAQNLDFVVTRDSIPIDSLSRCYKDQEDFCEQYGRLYFWRTLRDPSIGSDICPNGWHIPSHEEFEILVNYVDSTYTIGQMESSCSITAGRFLVSMQASKEGYFLDNFGFSAVYAGYYYSKGFGHVGEYAMFWSSTEYDEDNAYFFFMNSEYNSAYIDWFTKSDAKSIRCLKD